MKKAILAFTLTFIILIFSFFPLQKIKADINSNKQEYANKIANKGYVLQDTLGVYDPEILYEVTNFTIDTVGKKLMIEGWAFVHNNGGSSEFANCGPGANSSIDGNAYNKSYPGCGQKSDDYNKNRNLWIWFLINGESVKGIKDTSSKISPNYYEYYDEYGINYDLSFNMTPVFQTKYSNGSFTPSYVNVAFKFTISFDELSNVIAKSGKDEASLYICAYNSHALYGNLSNKKGLCKSLGVAYQKATYDVNNTDISVNGIGKEVYVVGATSRKKIHQKAGNSWSGGGYAEHNSIYKINLKPETGGIFQTRGLSLYGFRSREIDMVPICYNASCKGDYYIWSNFVSVYGGVTIKVPTSYKLNPQNCKVTKNINASNSNREDTMLYDFTDCVQTVTAKLNGETVYANIKIKETSAWEFGKLPSNRIKAGMGFEFSMNYTSNLIWGFTGNTGGEDTGTWVLIEDSNGKLRKPEVGGNEHNAAARAISDEITKLYVDINNYGDSLKIPSDSASQIPNLISKLTKINGSWKCSDKKVAWESGKNGYRDVTCDYAVNTYINKETSKVTYDKIDGNTKYSNEKYNIYKYGESNLCIKNKNGFCLFTSLNYPVSTANYINNTQKGNNNLSGFPILYDAYTEEKSVSLIDINKISNQGQQKANIGGKNSKILLQVKYLDGISINKGIETNPDNPDSDDDNNDSKYYEYRPIDLTNPFPKGLNSAGYNWTKYLFGDINKHSISEYQNAKTFQNTYNNKEYELSLSAKQIEQIQSYNLSSNYVEFENIYNTGNVNRSQSKFVQGSLGRLDGIKFSTINAGETYKLGCGITSYDKNGSSKVGGC